MLQAVSRAADTASVGGSTAGTVRARLQAADAVYVAERSQQRIVWQLAAAGLGGAKATLYHKDSGTSI